MLQVLVYAREKSVLGILLFMAILRYMTAEHIVILHGWSISDANEQKWGSCITALQQRGYRVTFLKLPGLSTVLEAPWHVAEYVSWIHQQIQDENGPFVLLGHSFGGQLAVRFTTIYPELVSELVLIDSAGIRDTSIKAVAKRTLFSFVAKVGKQFVSNDFFRQLLHKLARETDYYKADTVMRETMSNVLDDAVVTDLSLLSVPTLIIWGELDRITPIFLAHQFHAGIHHSQLVIIEGARHSPQFTHTDQVVDQIDLFLKKSP